MAIIPEELPIKRIKLPTDVPFWETTVAYNVLFQTLHILNDSIKRISFDSPKIIVTEVCFSFSSFYFFNYFLFLCIKKILIIFKNDLFLKKKKKILNII